MSDSESSDLLSKMTEMLAAQQKQMLEQQTQAENREKLLEKQLETMRAQSKEQIDAILKGMKRLDTGDGTAVQASSSRPFSIDAVEARIQEFEYDPEEDKTFENWWLRHQEIFEVDFEDWEDSRKVRMLLRHVHPKVEKNYSDSIAPKRPTEKTLKEVVDALTKMYGDPRTVFERRRAMLELKMSKENIDDIRTFAAKVNRAVQIADFSGITLDQMKCLVFLQGVDLPRYADVHLQMLMEVKKKDASCTLDNLIDVYNNSVQLRRESKAVTDEHKRVCAVKADPENVPRKRSPERQGLGSKYGKQLACYRCGNPSHRAEKCPYADKKCFKCGEVGHTKAVCRGEEKPAVKWIGAVTVGESRNELFEKTIEFRGVPVKVMLDTGSEASLISTETWERLGRPRLTTMDCDFKCVDGSELKSLGKYRTKLAYGGLCTYANVYVIEEKLNLLCLKHIEKLDLMSLRVDPARPVQKWQGCNVVQMDRRVERVALVNGCALLSENLAAREGKSVDQETSLDDGPLHGEVMQKEMSEYTREVVHGQCQEKTQCANLVEPREVRLGFVTRSVKTWQRRTVKAKCRS